MMEFMRSMAAGWVAKIFMGLLVLSFAVWGIADIFNGFGRGAVATVGETEIDVRDYQAELNMEVNALSNRLNQRFTIAQTAAFGLPNQVLGRMIGEATLNNLATDYNMGLSSNELAKTIAADPAFQNLGKFDRNYMTLVLRNVGTTEDRYVQQRQSLEVRRQLANGLTGLATVPHAALKVFNTFTFEKRDVDYLVLKEDALGEIAAPSDEALKTYFEEKKLTFRAPEYRSFDLVKLEPGDIVDPDAVSDEDAKTYYETAASRFIQPEKRQIQQILFNSEEEAKAASQKLKEGTSFAELLTERHLTAEDADIGLLTKQEVTDPAAAEAAFALEEGKVSDVVKGRFGHLLIQVSKIEASQAQPFEELKDRLKAEIATERANGEVLDLFDNIEDERAGGATLPEIAEKFNLKLRKVTDISKAGELANDDKITDLPEQQKLLTSVFETEIDFEADAIDISSTGFAWFQVSDIKPSRDRTLDEVKDKVATAWEKDERAKRNATLAGDILKQLKTGKSLADIATEKGLSVETAKDITRQAGGTLPASAVEQAFAGPVNHTSSAVNGSDQYVLAVTKITEPDFDADALQLDSLRRNLDANAGNDLLGQLSADIQRTVGITINQPLLNQVTSTSR